MSIAIGNIKLKTEDQKLAFTDYETNVAADLSIDDLYCEGEIIGAQPGPQGPVGPQGDTGPVGPAGPAGPVVF